MHDIRAIRAEPLAFDAAMARRQLPAQADEIIRLDADRRSAVKLSEEKQARRNALAREIAGVRKAGLDSLPLEAEGASIRDAILGAEARASAADGQLQSVLQALPNVLDPDVPDGRDEASNVVVHQSGEPTRSNTAREHFDLGEALGMMDFERAARLSGARFTILRAGLARLERALGQFMIDLHTQAHGYTETSVPLLVRSPALFGTGQLPKFAEDQFRTTDEFWLIPTAEVPLTNLVAGEIVPAADLPIRVTALSECFRSEAGSAGRDTRGMLRQHQFRKVELVSIVHPDDSAAELERMTGCAEAVLTALGLTWRRMLLCAGDTGFSAAKTYDLEVWLPGQGAWREISSCSNTRAFQARRMNARYRGRDGKPAGFVHTLNGSGVATGRALIAVMETYQQDDGSIVVPEVLRRYTGDLQAIARD